jgi:DNA-binding protein YbaB
MSTYDQAIGEMLKNYHEQLDKAAEMQRTLAEMTASATAVRQTVKVTVGGRGELAALEFPTGAYKRMPPQELASVIVATAAQAREKVAEQVAELVGPTLPSGLDISALVSGTANVRDVLSDEPKMPETVREYVDHGRRGEPGR